MSATPKTIQIFLPQGDPRGLRVAEITTRTVQVIEVPRKLLGDFFKIPESKQVGIYFLIGGDREDGKQEVYVGQTGELKRRLNQHNQIKDFWQRALVIVSRTNTLTQTHATFLEWHCLEELRKVGRFSDVNKTKGTQPHTPAPLEAECLELFETSATLLATLGFPCFTPLVTLREQNDAVGLFYCKGSDFEGVGRYTSEGFIVFAGSKARLRASESAKGTWAEKIRTSLMQENVLVPKDEWLVFATEHMFNSPSAAAVAITGNHSNGWIMWKAEDGRTLDEVYRQNTTEEDGRDIEGSQES
jgi:hypothetical protein